MSSSNTKKTKDRSTTFDEIKAAIHKESLSSYKGLKSQRANDLKNGWFHFSLAYLAVSKTLISKSIDDNSFEGRMHIIPALFNFRHSIELVLKFLAKFLGISLDKTHDISDLLDKVLLSLRKKSAFKIEAFIKEMREKGHRISESGMDEHIDELVNDLEGIVNKHYFQAPLQASLNNEDFFMEDHSNELFKYPEARNITINISSISLINIKSQELELIKSDIEKMDSIVTIFYGLLK
jgi:hypothetical protein